MTDDADATHAYYESLPRKRIGAGLICRDRVGRVLLVQPTYKPTWEIPGGVVEAGESPAMTVAREIEEELGVTLPVGRLLVVDWLPVRRPKTEGLMIQFDGGVIDGAVTRRFRLPAAELRDWRFFAPGDLGDALPDHTARRTLAALEMIAAGGSAYLEWGRPIGAHAVAPSEGTPTLLLMKGPPGSGKSTVAREIGRRLRWPVIDKDAFRDLLPDELGGVSYRAMMDVAARQLEIGLSVVADSPLGYGESYHRAVQHGRETGARLLVVECKCSDEAEWRRRIEQRARRGLASHHATEWSRVDAFHQRAAADPYEVDVPRLVVDTVAPLDEAVARVLAWIERHGIE
jgi:8-oxo-dGTP pyrophosphatase MutT (NUDIX family)/predicted kinase